MAPLLRLRTWLCVSALLFPSWGCARQRPARSPREAVESFGKALAQGQLEAAYGLLSSAQREAVSLDEFKNKISANQIETKVLSKASTRVLVVRVEATVELADGSRLRLTQEGDSFRIDQPIADFYPRQTPREALVTFVRAIEAERWDVLLTLMPEADRGDLDAKQLAARMAPQLEEVTRIAALLKVQLEAPIEIVGDRATMPYGEGATMRFVRESDGWKVEDPE
jgi:hypothetical protein